MNWTCSRCGTANDGRSFACAVCAAAPGSPRSGPPAPGSSTEVPPMPPPVAPPSVVPPSAAAAPAVDPFADPPSGSKTPVLVAAFLAVAVLAGAVGWLVAGRGDDPSTSAGDGGAESGLVDGGAPDGGTGDAGLLQPDATVSTLPAPPPPPIVTVPTSSSTTTSTTIPEPSAPVALQQLRTEGREALGLLDGRWFPQISSKFVGLEADGITYDDEAILANHQRLVEELPDDELVLVWSGDYATFSRGDAWVTVVLSPSVVPEDALRWCGFAGMGPDDCFGKLIGTVAEAGETTAYQR